MSNQQSRLIRMETVFENIDRRLNNIDDRLNSIENDMKYGFKSVATDMKALESDMKQGFNKLDFKVDQNYKDLNGRLWSNFLWLMGSIIGLAGIIAHTQHWL